jgi:hypothetical protein
MSKQRKLFHIVHGHSTIKGLDNWILGFTEFLRTTETAGEALTAEPGAADFILFVEAGYRRFKLWEPNRLQRHPLVREYPRKCYVWSSEDHPLTYLPGLYASMEVGNFDTRLHRAFRQPNFMTEHAPIEVAPERDLLYSFVGAPTSAVRRRILGAQHPGDALVRETMNFNHNAWAGESKASPFAQILARSVFTLCPRGVGVSIFRTYESMRAGSVPVVLADELVLPSGPRWDECSVRMAEKDSDRIEEVLRGIEDTEARGRLAAAEYERYFCREKMLSHLRRELEALGPADQSLARRHHTKVQLRRLLTRMTNRARRGLSR